MNLHYRILSIDEDEFSFAVRFFTDALSERELSIDPNEQSETPERCRTDYNLNLWREMTEDQLHQHIAQSAPVQWLMRKERAKAKTQEYVQSLASAKVALGARFTRPVLPNGTIDMSMPPVAGKARTTP
jgi:hypothetical protein